MLRFPCEVDADKETIELNSGRPLFAPVAGNFLFIFSVYVSEKRPYVKSFKPTSYKMNRDHKTFDSAQNKIWKMEEKAKVKTVNIIFFKSEGTTRPINHCEQ